MMPQARRRSPVGLARWGADAAVVQADFSDDDAAARLAGDAAKHRADRHSRRQCGDRERRRAWETVTPAHIEAHVAVNFTAVLMLIEALVPAMAERGLGRVIALGSVLAGRPRAETVVYASLKSALLTAIRAIARDVAHRGVTMNVIAPGAIETERTAKRYADRRFSPCSGRQNSGWPAGPARGLRRSRRHAVQRRRQLCHRRRDTGRRRLVDRRCRRACHRRHLQPRDPLAAAELPQRLPANDQPRRNLMKGIERVWLRQRCCPLA